MKIALIGATGVIGQRILREALSRGHEVTAIVRDPAKVSPAAGLSVATGDIFDTDSVAAAAHGHDAIVSAYGAPHDDPRRIIDAAHALIAGTRKAGVSRLLIVGGAGGLEVAPGVRLVDTPDFPELWKPIAIAAIESYDVYRSEATDLEWSFFSPAAFIQPGERTGKFRTAVDTLVVDANGESRISAEDYAIALVDELEQRQYVRARFTVGY